MAEREGERGRRRPQRAAFSPEAVASLHAQGQVTLLLLLAARRAPPVRSGQRGSDANRVLPAFRMRARRAWSGPSLHKRPEGGVQSGLSCRVVVWAAKYNWGVRYDPCRRRRRPRCVCRQRCVRGRTRRRHLHRDGRITRHPPSGRAPPDTPYRPLASEQSSGGRRRRPPLGGTPAPGTRPGQSARDDPPPGRQSNGPGAPRLEDGLSVPGRMPPVCDGRQVAGGA